MNRRDILKTSITLPLLHATRLYAAPQADSKLLVVFLRGAYDAASLLIPLKNDFYEEMRPNIAISQPGSGPDAALPLDADWGLHPALKESLFPLYERKQLAFIPFAGTHNLSRSHFKTQNSIELGLASEKDRSYRSGFMNRLAQVLGGDQAQAGAFTRGLPSILTGELDIPNITLKPTHIRTVNNRQRKLIEAMYADTELAEPVGQSYNLRTEAMIALEKEMKEANGGALSSKGLEGEARRIATLMRERFNIGFIDVGGWDTHVQQGNSVGTLANHLRSLGRALAGFADGMGPLWKHTVVIVISEFGRTFQENGNKGTDHGYGTTYWILGGSINGGRIAGEQVRVTKATLHQNRDFPLLNEYRSVLGGLFSRIYDLDSKQLERIFSNSKAKDLRLI